MQLGDLEIQQLKEEHRQRVANDVNSLPSVLKFYHPGNNAGVAIELILHPFSSIAQTTQATAIPPFSSQTPNSYPLDLNIHCQVAADNVKKCTF